MPIHKVFENVFISKIDSTRAKQTELWPWIQLWEETLHCVFNEENMDELMEELMDGEMDG